MNSLREKNDKTAKALAAITESLELIKQLPEIQKIISESKNKLESDLAKYNKKILSILIEDLDLSPRAMNCLINDNIICILDLFPTQTQKCLRFPI